MEINSQKYRGTIESIKSLKTIVFNIMLKPQGKWFQFFVLYSYCPIHILDKIHKY